MLLGHNPSWKEVRAETGTMKAHCLLACSQPAFFYLSKAGTSHSGLGPHTKYQAKQPLTDMAIGLSDLYIPSSQVAPTYIKLTVKLPSTCTNT